METRTGDTSWDYDWFIEQHRLEGIPEVHFCESEYRRRHRLDYDTAWAPNNGTLQRLHEMTGWRIGNDCIEEGAQRCGSFTCAGW